MKRLLPIAFLALMVSACSQGKPDPWAGPQLTQPRSQLTTSELQKPDTLALLDMSFFAQPAWGKEAVHGFSGDITFVDTKLIFPLNRPPYEGEDIFPGFSVGFITHEGELIPLQKDLLVTRHQSESHWDAIVGTGKVWQEEVDGPWSRASFPISLTDRYIGQVRNCVATFVFNPDTISNVYVQCSQETADLNAGQVGNIRVMLKAEYQPKTYTDAESVIEQHNRFKSARLPVYPLSGIDSTNEIAEYFEESFYTNASTSLGAVLVDDKLYMHPPKTRHGLYPYPADMHHGVYSVTKSMTGTLSMLYLAERYGEGLFDEHITDYVPALEGHPGWEGVTFSHTLNMVTGTEGSEQAEHLLHIIVLASTAEEGINNVASLGDYPGAPGEYFNYASTNLFVLSYALQNYVEKKEGENTNYWDLVHENVLVPIGADHFAVQHTLENDGSQGIPMLAYGAFPTADEAAKIALLFSNDGSHEGAQLLHREKTREALGRTEWVGYQTGNDYRGSAYRHALWSKSIKTSNCTVQATYMLGYGANYVLFLPGKTVIIRFMDEYDLDINDLVRRVEKRVPSCP